MSFERGEKNHRNWKLAKGRKSRKLQCVVTIVDDCLTNTQSGPKVVVYLAVVYILFTCKICYGACTLLVLLPSRKRVSHMCCVCCIHTRPPLCPQFPD